MTDLRDARHATEAGEPALREHQAAASVVSACLAAQARTPRPSRLSRLFGASPLNGESRKWYAGAVTELRIAGELAKLGPEWVVLHSVPVGERGEIVEHLAIGPAGVFAVGLMHEQGSAVSVQGEQLLVNGAARPHLAVSRDAATEAAVRLTRASGVNVPVRGLLVAIAPRSLAVLGEPDDVGVTSERGLHKRLATAAGQLDSSQVAAIVAVASEPSTWHNDVARRRIPVFDPGAFDGLRIDVQRAWVARGFWGCAVLVAAAITAAQFVAA
ncbi:nuclease-related domain-containing protein [Gryllotalpicola reticulitermitis]|uniref:Nuclease-related domain-containing protein n=1 Tax=Gryllotalpicola reticulitermitis TaxID=1184153 RepID=A0ABV8QA32_9MICO